VQAIIFLSCGFYLSVFYLFFPRLISAGRASIFWPVRISRPGVPCCRSTYIEQCAIIWLSCTVTHCLPMRTEELCDENKLHWSLVAELLDVTRSTRPVWVPGL